MRCNLSRPVSAIADRSARSCTAVVRVEILYEGLTQARQTAFNLLIGLGWHVSYLSQLVDVARRAKRNSFLRPSACGRVSDDAQV